MAEHIWPWLDREVGRRQKGGLQPCVQQGWKRAESLENCEKRHKNGSEWKMTDCEGIKEFSQQVTKKKTELWLDDTT